MKLAKYLSLALVTLASAALVGLASAEDAPIDPVPQEIVGFESLGVLDFADPNVKLDGWEARDKVTITRGEKSLVVDSTTSDPYIFSAMLGTFVPEDARQKTKGKTLVKITARHSNEGSGQIFFADEKNGGYDEGRSAHFDFPVSDEFRDYVVPLDVAAPLLRLRFDLGGSEGKAELARVELIRVVYKPVKFGTCSVEDGTLKFDLVNNDPAPVQVKTKYFGVDPRKSYPGSTIEISNDALVDLYYAQKKPFEEIEVAATLPDGDVISRRFFAFHESVADAKPDAEAPTLENGSTKVVFASDGSGAEIFRDGKRAAALCPLFQPEGDGCAILPDETDFSKLDLTAAPAPKAGAKPGARLVPVLKGKSGDAVEFAIAEVPVEKAREYLNATMKALTEFDALSNDPPELPVLETGKTVGSLKFRLDGEVLSYEFDAPIAIHAPTIRVLGEMEQAIYSGCEYLEKGERSSSTLDIETPEHIRFARPISWTTAPFASIVTDRGSVSLLYDNPKDRSFFAVPDFLDGDETSSRMDACAKKGSGKIRVGAALEPIEEAILWSVNAMGLPDPPTPPYVGKEMAQFLLDGFEKSNLKTPKGWRHAVMGNEPPEHFPPRFGVDFASTIWEISGKLPEVPELVPGGAHLENAAAFLLTGKGSYYASQLNGRLEHHLGLQKEDGSFRYSGKYLKGSKTDSASGHCANSLFQLMEVWRLTKNPKAIPATIKGLEFANQYKTPAGAQVWELSLHTPDIMASARMCLANVYVYEATGEQKYLDEARRWALTGIPFVYLWEDDELTPGKQPLMKYATIAVFGATSWVSPNWMGRPVQWCGLDYAHALIRLAPHDKTLDWLKIAEGIVASAECQLGTEPKFVGLLPDSFTLDSQTLNGPYINPCVVWQLRNMIEGKPTNLSVVDCGEHRLISPFPAKVEGNVVKISAQKGVKYEVIVDGTRVETIESQGEDEISL
ncbi:MAG: hypothetical protein IJM30_12620 [Thermoguttaceae bacterium]|nr:hypothetical protein [Thermoguttaceae bacterium]